MNSVVEFIEEIRERLDELDQEVVEREDTVDLSTMELLVKLRDRLAMLAESTADGDGEVEASLLERTVALKRAADQIYEELIWD